MKIDQKKPNTKILYLKKQDLKRMNSQFKAIFIMFVPLTKATKICGILFNFIFKLIW